MYWIQISDVLFTNRKFSRTENFSSSASDFHYRFCGLREIGSIFAFVSAPSRFEKILNWMF